jgi:hypothetical protein
MTKYQSKYCDKQVTAAQYLAESMCEREARDKKIILPQKFWEDKKWAKAFRRHITQVNKLLKEFPDQAIISAFHSKKAEDVFSFANKKFFWIVREHAKRMEKWSDKVTEVPEQTDKHSRFIGKKTQLETLKEVEQKLKNGQYTD